LNKLYNNSPWLLGEVFFGFEDEYQFLNWFDNNDDLLKELGVAGATLVCYRVSERYDGAKQSCAPKADRAPENIKWRISLSEYVKSGILSY
jgi:hypothetical protein